MGKTQNHLHGDLYKLTERASEVKICLTQPLAIKFIEQCTLSSQQSSSSSAFKATFKPFHHTLEGTQLHCQENAATYHKKGDL